MEELMDVPGEGWEGDVDRQADNQPGMLGGKLGKLFK
jgi:hypothetical protein